jgi:hypothetical protein
MRVGAALVECTRKTPLGVAELPTMSEQAAAPGASSSCPTAPLSCRPPTGHTYTTEPHRASMFSALNQDTGELNIPPHPVWRETNRSLMMPRRKQTREQHRPRPHQPGTTRENRTHRRRRTTTPSLARRQLRTTALMRRLVSEPEVGVQTGIGVRCLVDRVVVQRRVVDRAVVH